MTASGGFHLLARVHAGWPAATTSGYADLPSAVEASILGRTPYHARSPEMAEAPHREPSRHPDRPTGDPGAFASAPAPRVRA